MRFPSWPIVLTRISVCLAIATIGARPVQGEPLVRKQSDLTLQKAHIALDEAPADAQPSTDLKSVKPQYWLGVRCDAIGPALRAQLNIDSGLTIRDIVENTPAQKAGLQIYDVILRINEQPLGTVDELRHIVRTSQGLSLDVMFLRSGKENSVTVRPELMPPCEELAPIMFFVDGELDAKVLEELKNSFKLRPGAAHREIILFRTGVVLDKGNSDDESTNKVPSNTDNTPNGAGLHFDLQEIKDEAVLVDSAEFNKDHAMSGCCMKLLRVLGDQIQAHEAKIKTLRAELNALDENKVSVNVDDNDVRANLERKIQVLESSLERWQEAQARLKAMIEERPKSDDSESEPDQSKRFEFHLRNWS